MNDNESMEVQDFTAEEMAVFDAGWDDAESPTLEAEGGADEAAAAEAESVEPAEDEPEPQDEPKPEPGQAPQEGNQLFKVTHLGKEKELSLDEMTALAQKGLDYDHVRQERDELRGQRPENYAELRAQAESLNELAALTGKSVDELVLRARATKLMQEDSTLSESDAIIQAMHGRQPAAQPAAGKQSAGKEPSAAEQAKLRQFMEAYPDVRAENIPQEVWQDAFTHDGDLTGAYTRWENRQLRTELSQLKQTKENKTRSTGSRRTAGAAASKDPFDEGWDS